MGKLWVSHDPPPPPVWLQVPCLPAPTSPGVPTLGSPAVLTVLGAALRRTGGSLAPMPGRATWVLVQ